MSLAYDERGVRSEHHVIARGGCNPSSALCHLKGCQQVIVGGDARIQPA